MSPLKLGLCLHYHSSLEDDPWLDRDAPCRDQTMDDLVRDGLLIDQWCDSPYAHARPSQRFKPTPKLHAFVAMLEATPLPEQRWLDPRTQVAIEGPGLREQ